LANDKNTETKKTFEDKKFLAELEKTYKDLRFTIKKVQHKNDNITAYMYETSSRILSVDSSAICPVYCDDNTFGRDTIPSTAKQYEMFKKAVRTVCGHNRDISDDYELVMMPEKAQWPLFAQWFVSSDTTIIYTLDRDYLLENIKKIVCTLSLGNGAITIPEATGNELKASNGL